MTDARLRALERRFRETGALQDEAAWLAACVQAGRITEDRLSLAADLKYGPARVARNRRPADYVDLQLWPRELVQRWGNEVLVRVSLASTRRACETLQREHIRARLDKGLAAIEAWLDDPSGEHLEHAQGAVVSCRVESSFSLGVLIQETVGAMTLTAGQAADRFSRAVGFQAVYLAADYLNNFDLNGTQEVRRAIEREVVPWALGLSEHG